MQKQCYLCLLMIMSAMTLAAESRIIGNLQIQGAYLDPSLHGDGRWFLQAPNSWLGLEVLETLAESEYRGVIEADLNPLAFDEAVTARAVFIERVQALYSLRGGLLPSLEQRLLVDSINQVQGFDGSHISDSDPFRGALAIENPLVSLSEPSIEIIASSGEMIHVSGQWTFADTSSGSTLAQWALATGLDTPEGSIAFTYRRNDDGDGLWGSSILWQSEGLQLGAATLHQGELLAWDLIGAYQAGATTTKLSYGRDELEGGGDSARYWSFGIDRALSQAIVNYSEMRWQPEAELWYWMTGFRLSF